MTTTVFELPMLYGNCRTGKQKMYKVSVVDNGDGSCSVLREHGRLGGKTQVDEKKITGGKNVGRMNETFVRDQAIAEAKAFHKKKLDVNYSTSPDTDAPQAHLLPMLAESFAECGHHLKYPCLGQNKLNGVRCMAKRTGNQIDFTSRKGKSYNSTLGHLVPNLLAIMQDGEIFDGEIYIHGLPLQTIVSYVKKLRPESKLLKYYVYDIGDATKTFEKRYATYSSVIPENDKIIAVQCVTINSPDDIQFAHDGFVEEGYEGLILRNKLGLYQFNLIRSKDLIKFKRFEDKEFTIIGGKTAVTGRYEGGCVFRCRCENGEEFDVAPRGSMERRRKYYQDLPKLINKELTVRFIGRSLAGIPQHVVGIVVRDYE